MAALNLKMAAPPAVALVQILLKMFEKRATAIYQKKRCYSGSRHLSRITILRPGCAIYRRYLIICLRHLINTEDIEEYQEETVMSINKHKLSKNSTKHSKNGAPTALHSLEKTPIHQQKSWIYDEQKCWINRLIASYQNVDGSIPSIEGLFFHVGPN